VLLPNRLAHSVDNWRLIQANSVVLTHLLEGFRLPTLPSLVMLEGKIFPNITMSAAAEHEISATLEKLVIQGVLEQVQVQPSLIMGLFSVPKDDGGTRMIYNCKPLNAAMVEPEAFKLENLRHFVSQLDKDDLMLSVDLKDGFYHLPVHKDSRKYLGVQWHGNYYVFNALPMGMSWSPYVFYKTTKEVANYIRSLGIKCSVYMDDFIFACKKGEEEHVLSIVQKTFAALGWVINDKKSVLIPTTTIKHLGMIISSESMTLSVPQQKIDKAVELINRVLSLHIATKKVPIRMLASIAGKLESFALAAPLIRSFAQSVYQYHFRKGLTFWDSWTIIEPKMVEEFDTLLKGIKHWNGNAIVREQPNSTLTTDASLTGWCYFSWRNNSKNFTTMADSQSSHQLFRNVSSNLRRRTTSRQVTAQSSANPYRQSSREELPEQQIRTNTRAQFAHEKTSIMLLKAQHPSIRSNMDSIQTKRGGSIVERARQARLQATPTGIPKGTSYTAVHNRSIRVEEKFLASQIQHRKAIKQR